MEFVVYIVIWIASGVAGSLAGRHRWHRQEVDRAIIRRRLGIA